MKRALLSGFALLSIVGASTGVAAESGGQPNNALGQVGRFQQRAIPAVDNVTGNFNTADPDKVVSATVILVGDSVLAARSRAERLNRRFDQASVERQVAAQQSAIGPSLQAAGATLRSSTQRVLNAVTVQVKVRDVKALGAVPGVSSVHVSYQLERFNGVSDVFTGVPDVWGDYGYTGSGFTVGVIDDGIDYYHANFGGSGDPADWENDDGTAIEPGTFPTVKVTGGTDFVGDAYDAGDEAFDTPQPDADPLACGEHGTHVAGTAAGQGVLSNGSTFTGPYAADTIAGEDFLVAPGSAPEAFINMYKVFGCEGSVNDDVLLDAIEAAVVDGVDVINMSLGSAWGTPDDPIALAIDEATAAGVLVVVSAGNDGPNAYQVGGPSTANTALSVAAADVANETLPAVAVTGGVTISGLNSNLWDYATSGPIVGELVDVGLGCDLADYAATAGKIAVTTRGACDRVIRAIHATDAGALGVIFINNAGSLPPLEGVIPGANVPFVGVPAGDGALFTDGLVITLDGGAPFANPDYQAFASFTSNGPRSDSAPKPDITAPGVGILSSAVGTGTEGVLLSGTSMAAPHTAGIAVLMREAQPTWTPLQVKAALMSTADPDDVTGFTPLRGGTGMVDALAAVETLTFLSTTDGRHNLAYGFRQLTGAYIAARSITINNKTSSPITYDLTADTSYSSDGIDPVVSISPSTVVVPANSSRSVSVSLSIPDPSVLPLAEDSLFGDLQAFVGMLVATPRNAMSIDGAKELLAPMVLVPNGVSDIRAAGLVGSAQPTANSRIVSSLKIANNGAHEGNYDVYQWVATDDKDDHGGASVPDIRDVGIQSLPFGDDTLVVVAISTNQRIATQSTGEYDVLIDIDNDESYDYVLVGIDNGLFTAGAPDGLFSSFLLDYSTFEIVDSWDAIAPPNGSTVLLPFLLSSTGGCECSDGPWAFAVETYSVVADLMPDWTDNFAYYDPTATAVETGGYGYLPPGESDTFEVGVDTEFAIDQGALGWLVVSLDDTAGTREADRVPLRAKRSGRGAN